MTREQATTIVEQNGMSSFDCLISDTEAIVASVARVNHVERASLTELSAAIEWLKAHGPFAGEEN